MMLESYLFSVWRIPHYHVVDPLSTAIYPLLDTQQALQADP